MIYFVYFPLDKGYIIETDICADNGTRRIKDEH